MKIKVRYTGDGSADVLLERPYRLLSSTNKACASLFAPNPAADQMRFFRRHVLCLLVFLLSLVVAAQSFAQVYVSQSGDNTTGDSWATALTSIHDAVTQAAAGADDVWIAAGDYLIGSAIMMQSGVALYGGFPSTGNPGFGDRDASAYITTLDGQGAADNLIICNNVNNVRIDGLTLVGSRGGGPGYAGKWCDWVCGREHGCHHSGLCFERQHDKCVWRRGKCRTVDRRCHAVSVSVQHRE